MDFSSLKKYNEVAILFSEQFNSVVTLVHQQLTDAYPNINILLVSSSEILCAAKCDKYESYILLGIECPIHTFSNAIQYKINLDNEKFIQNYDGFIAKDSIYPHHLLNNKDTSTDSKILVVTESQTVLDYYCSIYEDVEIISKSLELKSRVKFLMKENILSLQFKNKRMIGVVFTSTLFEDIADVLVKKINTVSRAYKIFLKDISYERLISIDNLDCIVLVDCPLFQCKHRLHIPVISSFSLECALQDKWSDVYDRNLCSELTEKSLSTNYSATEIMVKREYQGVSYTNDENDMTIHEGQKGIASAYEEEGKQT